MAKIQQIWVIEDANTINKNEPWIFAVFQKRKIARDYLQQLKQKFPTLSYRLTKYYSARYLNKCWPGMFPEAN